MVGPGNRPLVIAGGGGGGGFLSAGSAPLGEPASEGGGAFPDLTGGIRLGGTVGGSVVAKERTAVLAVATAAVVVASSMRDKILAANLQTGSGEVAIAKVLYRICGHSREGKLSRQGVSALAKQYGGLAAAAAALGFACGCGRRIEL